MTVAVVRLRPLSVLAEALRVYRRHLRLLLLAALILYAPFAVIDAVIEHAHRPVVLELAGGALEIALHLLVDIFYTGIVAAAAIGWRRGEQRTPREIARDLPWRTLLVLDVGLAVGTAALLIAFIVPGVIFYTWYALSPAVAEMDHVGVRGALRTSRRVVRGSFLRVLTVLAIVQVGSFAVEQVLQGALGHFVVHALVNLGIQLVSGPLFGLATVLMVFELRGVRAGARPAGPSPAGPTIQGQQMSIAERVKDDLTAARKAGERDRVATLGLVLSELQKAAKEGGADELAVLRRERKRRHESARAFRDGGRPELAEAEEAEATLIEGYLPAELSEDELRAIVVAAVERSGATSPKDMGRVMPLAMREVAGRADGRRVSEQVRAALR